MNRAGLLIDHFGLASVAKMLLLVLIAWIAPVTRGQTLQVLHSFQGPDGGLPWGGLVQGSDGMLYGTTYSGGDLSLNAGRGFGTAFKMTTNGNLTTLVTFSGNNGSFPHAPLVHGSDGNFYGTTSSGGDLSLNSGRGFGTIFKLTPDGTMTTLVRFNNRNGANPQYLVQGTNGELFGTAYGVNVFAFGGTNYGSIFKVTTNGVLTPLYWFRGGNDGRHPENAGLVEGTDGNFYGCSGGGASNQGTVFRITPGGAFTTLATFNGSNGSSPNTLVQGSDGNFYGTTAGGGRLGGGSVFKITPGGLLTTIVSFNIPPNDFAPGPWAGLVLATDGNFYGTTHGGNDSGKVFKMTPGGGLTNLVSFNGPNGANPESELVQGSDGALYGTTISGGTNNKGTVFRVVLPPPFLVGLKLNRSGDVLVITWPASETGAILEATTELGPGTGWSTVQPAPVVIDDQNVVTDEPDSASRFYRLRK